VRRVFAICIGLALGFPAAASATPTPGTTLVGAFPALSEDGRAVVPFGGEIEYYRLDPANWGKVLDTAAQASDTITTYVPWNWHASGPTEFDFTGRTDPRRDLVRFVRMAGDRGLRIVLRPGPWIVNEWPDGGNPAWLTDDTRADELQMRSPGEDWRARAAAYATALGTKVRYTSKTYRDAVAAWYAAFAGAVRSLQAPAGPVVGVQLDNETSFYFSGDPFSVDYHPETVAEFKRRTGEDAPTAFPASDAPDVRRQLRTTFHWQRYRGQQTSEFLAFLAERMRAGGIHLPLSTNGQSLNLTFDAGYRKLTRDAGVLLTNDTYVPSQVPTNADMRDAAARASWQDQLMRAFNPAAPAGMAEVGVVGYAPAFGVFEPGGVGTLTADEALSLVDMNTRLHLSQGMASIGYYMFAGRTDPVDRAALPARDPKHTLVYTAVSEMLGKGTAIAPDGSRRPHFAVMRDLHGLVAANRDVMAGGRPLLPVAIGWHAAAYYAPKQASATGLMGDVQEHGVRGVPYAVLDPLRAAGFVPGAAVLDGASAAELARHRAIVLPQTDYLSGAAQDALAEYVRRGGTVIAFPRLPARDDELEPDDRLARALLPGVKAGGVIDGPVAARSPAGPVQLFGPVTTYDIAPGSGAAVLARDDAGHVVGVERAVGDGHVIVLGGLLAGESNPTPSDLTNATQGGQPEDPVKLDPAAGPFVRRLLERVAVTSPGAALAHPANIEVVQRRRGGSAVLMVDNYESAPVSDRIRYTDPRTGSPAVTPEIFLPARSGLALPLQRAVAPGARIVVASAELRARSRSGQRTRLELWSPPGQRHATVTLSLVGRWSATIGSAPRRVVGGRTSLTVPAGPVTVDLRPLP
jgi:beta-galactosidase